MSFEITCVGDLMIECIVPLGDLPLENSTVILDGIPHQLGGSALNFCWYLSQLGLRSQLVGPYGQRDYSLVAQAVNAAQASMSDLIKCEGDTDLLVVFKGTPTTHRSLYIRSTLPEDILDLVKKKCGSSRYLILAGSRHVAMRTSFLQLAESFRGELIAFTPSYTLYEFSAPELRCLLAKVSITVLNDQESMHVCGMLNCESAEQLANSIPGMLIVTHAERGAEVYENGIRSIAGSYTESTSDVIGAGDAFFSGFLYKRITGSSVDEAARYGSALAGYVVDAAMVRIPITQEQVLARLQSIPYFR